MAMYRIKQNDASETLPYPPEEYWRDSDPSLTDELDLDEIAELNRAAEAEEARGGDPDELNTDTPLHRSWVRMLLALLLIVCFTVWLSVSLVGGRIDWGVLSHSARLDQDQTVAALKSAVVVIEGSGGNGSGFNISADGLIVTNRHVVEDSGIITVRFGDSQVFSTKEWVEIPDVDMALIDIDGSDLPYVPLATAEPAADDPVIFIGNPLGFDWTIAEGTVVGSIIYEHIPLLLLDGPVYPGSSGSPVFNEQSQVIAVVFARLTDVDNKGLAIPVSYLTTYLEDIYEH